MVIIFILCSQLALADSLYERGYYEEARIEYLRAFFFYPQLQNNIEVRMHHAVSVLKHDESQGISELNRIVTEFPELPVKIRREIAVQYLDTKRHYLAIDLLRDTEEKDLLGLAYLLDGQFMNARTTFLESGDNETAYLIDEYSQNPEKSERTAAFLSLLLPGAGEIYAGNAVLGIRDFSLNLGSGYLLYNAISQQKYVDATLVFVFMINRFYLGSIYNAQKAAFEYNEKNRREWLNDLQEILFQDLRNIPPDPQP
jgi:hypothetical protein